uniref:Uncharacterized protein n=1 Tax=Magnetococcus massalia (strain MO-1) TaxID=451514 RepID=A0A1S7LHH6_MAGMO|nr:protein of unknown function [Candidatus Magnetococcus massalia]
MIDHNTVYDFWASHPDTVGALTDTEGHVTIFTHLSMDPMSPDGHKIDLLTKEVKAWWEKHGKQIESCTVAPYAIDPYARQIELSA